MRIVVVGAGIVGLATARQLAIDRPDAEITVLDKESRVAGHQTGHNSGVIHAGIYYPPGSLKAQLCRRGSVMLREFCDDKGIDYRNIGKLVVALNADEADRLDEIQRRALANGVDDVRMIGASEIFDIEPYVDGVRALYSPSTGIVDFVAVTQAIADDLIARGGTVRTSTPVTRIWQQERGVVLLTGEAEFVADEVVVCAGLQSAELAVMAGDDPEPAIVPFRGEYYRIAQEHAHLVRGLVYPVPDPRYPFLGIHLTRRIDGTVDVGPNAVLALALEGYRLTDISPGQVAAVVRTPAFRKLARTHWRTGAKEMVGSLSKRYFLAQARKYLPALVLSDLEPAPAGVRAQAIRNDGQLVDDFWISRRPRITLVRNAPSPAATSSLAIAEHITRQVLQGVAS
jgi:L-2-hydroxyglutarate oxidase LhgO